MIPKSIYLFSIFVFAGFCMQAQEELPNWALGPFVRPAGANPIISPDPDHTFFDPMSTQEIAWEAVTFSIPRPSSRTIAYLSFIAAKTNPVWVSASVPPVSGLPKVKTVSV